MTAPLESPTLESPRRLLVIGVHWPLETFLDNLLRGLAAAGWSVTIASRHGFGAEAGLLRRLPLPGEGLARFLAFLPRHAATLLTRPGRALQLLRRLNEKTPHFLHLLPLLASDFELFYFPWNGAALDYLPLFEFGIPTLVSCRGSHVQISPHNPERRFLRDQLPSLFAAATAVHGVSREIVREAAGFGLDVAKAEVIHPAVDPHFFQPAETEGIRSPVAKNPGELRLIGAGSLIWRKGFEYALRALAELIARGVPARLTLIGDGPDRQQLLFAIDDLELGDAVALVGRKKPAEVRDLLRASDVFLLPSVSEGISNAALEAMACGLPVISSDCGGMREAIENGRDGLLVPPRDPLAIADAAHELAKDPARRAELGRAARQRVLKDFTLEAQIASFDRLLRSLLTRRMA